MGNETRTIDVVTSLITPIADDFGVEIIDVEFNEPVLKVVIDQTDGLDSQVLVDVTKAISRMIDAEDPVPGTFTLEVTSPGVERPLKQPHHFQRAIGSDVAVKTEPDVDGDRRIEGALKAADEYGVTISTESGERTLRYGEIRSARTTFAWGPGPKPGKQKKSVNAATTEAETKESASR